MATRLARHLSLVNLCWFLPVTFLSMSLEITFRRTLPIVLLGANVRLTGLLFPSYISKISVILALFWWLGNTDCHKRQVPGSNTSHTANFDPYLLLSHPFPLTSRVEENRNLFSLPLILRPCSHP